MLKVPNAKVISAPGAIFATAITGADIDLKNAQTVTFIITSGTGTAATPTLKVMAKTGSAGDAAAVDFILQEVGSDTQVVGGATSGQEITIGGAAAANLKAYRATITADMLTGTGYDTVYCTVTAVSSSTVPGSIIAVTNKYRYSV